MTNASFIIGEMTRIIQPIVMNQMKILLEKNKDTFLEGIKNMIPAESIAIPDSTQTTKNSTTPTQIKKPTTK